MQGHRKWRQNERGLRVIQIGGWPRSLTGGWPSDDYRQNARAIIHKVHEVYGDTFRTCITPRRIESDVEEIMIKEDVVGPELMHYNEQHSKNNFGNETIGLLIGSIDPGDENILDMLAEQGLEARPERYEDGDRAHGRKFVGPDADAAQEFLESVREENVAQAIGRYARNARGENADDVTVYAWTDAIPEHMVDGKAPGIIGRKTNTKDAMIYVVDKQGPITMKEVADHVNCHKEYVRQTFNELAEQGTLSVSEETGKYGANEYDINGEDLSPIVVDLEPEPI